MAGKETTETVRANGSRPPRAHRAPRRKAAAKAARTPRRGERRSQLGHVVATGALVVLGAMFILGAAAFAALLAGYEPPGYERKARRVRRYALAHAPELPSAAEAWEPIGRELGHGGSWMRKRIHEASR